MSASGRTRPWRRALFEHTQVIELIREGQAEEAEALWHEHLRIAREILMAESGANTAVDLL